MKKERKRWNGMNLNLNNNKVTIIKGARMKNKIFLKK